MFFKKYFRFLPTLYLLVSLTFSCKNIEKIAYFNNNEGQANDSISPFFYSPVLKKNDVLTISISSLNLEAVKPFNQLYFDLSSNKSNNNSENIVKKTYLINHLGEIDFPVLGKIKLEGLTKFEVKELLAGKLKEYVSDAVITVSIENFSITVLGDVKVPGTFKVNDDRISILQALGFAGDLTNTAVRKNILVIREDGEKKKEIRLDLTSKKALNSEAFYLRQNDVVYVQPNRAKANSSMVGSFFSITVSLISLVITTLTILLTR